MAKPSFSPLTVALTAVVVSSIVAAAGLTLADHDTTTGGSSESWSCDMNAGGEKGQGPTTCGGQSRPDWGGCILFQCTATSGGGGGGGSCGSMSAPAGQWYEWDSASNSCALMGTPASGDACTACMNAGGAAATCPSCPGYTGTTSGGGGEGCPAPSFTDKPSCVAYCTQKGMGQCDWACDDLNPCGPGTGGSGVSCPAPTFTDKPSCTSYCVTNQMMGAATTAAMCDPICDDFNPCGPGTGTMSDCDRCISEGGTRISCENSGRCPRSGGGGATSYAECVALDCASMVAPAAYQACKNSCQSRFGGDGGGSSTRWCFYSNATRNRQELGYSIACPEGSMADCHKYTQNGEKVDPAGLVLNASSSCWSDGSGGGGNCSSRYGQGTREYRCCMNPSSSECTGGSMSLQKCAYPNGVTLYCESPHVRCRKTMDMSERVLSDAEVGANGASATCGPVSGGGGSSMRQCIYHNASWQMGNQLKKTPGSIGKDVYCKADYEGCDVLSTVAGTQKSLPVDTPQGYGIPAPRADVSLGAPFCCQEGWQNKCEGSSGGGGEGDCRSGCKAMAERCTRSATVAFSPMRCESLETCLARCPGGGKPEPEGCRVPPPTSEIPGTWKCVGKEWKFTPMEDRKPPENFCKKYPEDEKCRKPKPVPVTGTLEEKLAALEKTINTLSTQIKGLRTKLQGAKDDIAAKNDEIRALKKSSAPRAKINAAQKELKGLKRDASAIKSDGQDLMRELKFREKEYDRLSRQVPPPYQIY